MSAAEEMDRIISNMEHELGRLRALRARQVIQLADGRDSAGANIGRTSASAISAAASPRSVPRPVSPDEAVSLSEEVGEDASAEWIAARVGYDLRNRMYDHIQYLPFTYHDHAQSGQLISRCIEDVRSIERFAGGAVAIRT